MAHSKLEDWRPVIGELVIAKFNVESELSIGKIFIAEVRNELFDGKLYRIRYGHNRENQVFDVIVPKKQLTPWVPLTAWGTSTIVESSLEDKEEEEEPLHVVTPTPGNTPREEFFEKKDALDHFMTDEARNTIVKSHKPPTVQSAIHDRVSKMKTVSLMKKPMRPKGRYNHFLADVLKL